MLFVAGHQYYTSWCPSIRTNIHTDGRTDGRMDGRTDGRYHRVALLRLKIQTAKVLKA